MLQDCLLILHTLTQIMTLNYYAIQISFIGKSVTVLMHFIANTLVLFLLLYCIFAWKHCGFKVHFLITLLHLVKLIIFCIDFATTMVHFAILYKIFLTILISTNVCTILAETVSIFTIVRKTTNLTQQNSMHEMHKIA